jgi:hypothetical protein
MNARRKLAVVTLVHAVVVLGSPAVAALIFLCLTLDMRSSMHIGGALAFGFGVLYSCLFYSAKTLVLVLLASPLLWGLAKIRWGLVAFGLGVVFGAALGWLFGQLLMAGEGRIHATNASLAAAIAGALGALAIEWAWRVWPPAPAPLSDRSA